MLRNDLGDVVKMARRYSFGLEHTDNLFKLHVIESMESESANVNEEIKIDGDDFSFYFLLSATLADQMGLEDLERHSSMHGYMLGKDQIGILRKVNEGKLNTYCHSSYRLPLDITALTRFVIALEVCMIGLEKRVDEVDVEDPLLTYCQQIPNEEGLEAFVANLAGAADGLVKLTTPFTRLISQWMHDCLLKVPEPTEAQLSVLNDLKKLLAENDVSLAKAAHQYAYAPLDMRAVYAELAKDYGQIIADLLNPDVADSAKNESKLLNQLTDVYSQFFGTRDVDGMKTTFFYNLKDAQVDLWKALIKTLHGKKAHDGGVYSRHYTEIALLNQSVLVLNQDGLFELKYLETESYRDDYRPGERNAGILGEELAFAMNQLGLQFKPDQDFHQTAVFTEESTQLLKKHGFHYSQQYFAGLPPVKRQSAEFGLFAMSPELPAKSPVKTSSMELK